MTSIQSLLPFPIIINIEALSDLTSLALTAVIIGALLLGKNKTRQTWLLAGSFTGVMGIIATFLILDVSAVPEWVPLQFQSMLLALGFLLQFAYHFPYFSPENTRAARVALMLTSLAFLAGLGAAASWYCSLTDLMTVRIIYFGMVIAEYFYIITVFTGRTIHISRRNETQDKRTKTPGRPMGALAALLRPVGREARATRAFAVIISAPLLLAFWTLAYYAGMMPYTFFLLTLDTGFLVGLFIFTMIYLNFAVEPTTFMVKLVLSTLVIVLTMSNVMFRMTLTVHELNFAQTRLSEVSQAEDALFRKGNPDGVVADDLPDSVHFIVSRPLGGGPYVRHFSRDDRFNLDFANKKGLDILPAISFIRAGYENDSFFSLFRFTRRGREYTVGFPLALYREAINPHALPIMLVILGSTAAVLLLFPLFLRISLVKPLERLLEGVHLVNAGQKKVSLPVRYNDEIGYLTRAFNRMVESLREADDLKAMHQEMELARKIQTSLLPKSAPVLPGLDIAGTSIPARMVGGDLFFYHEFPSSTGTQGNGCAVAIGDVTGKGMPAALYMAVSTAVLAAKAPVVGDVARFMTEMNETLNPYMSNNYMFTALCYMRIDPDPRGSVRPSYVARIANAGLIPPVFRRGKECRYLELGGLPLGILADVPPYRTNELHLQSGDMIVLSSDGLVEAENDAGEMYGFDRLLNRASSAPLSAGEAIEWILSDVRNFTGTAEQHDDMTAVAVIVT